MLLARRNILAIGAALALGSVTGFATGASAKPEIGKPAPDFSAVDTKGKTVALSALRGKTVVLEWTNADCPYVRKHYGAGNMQKLQGEAAAEGVVWLSLISSAPGEQGHVSPAEADQLTASRHAEPASVLLDEKGKIGRAYDARTTPHMFVINGDGTLVYMGGIDDKPTTSQTDIQGATNYVRLALDAVKSGKPVATPVSRPYGCSVKYSPQDERS
ncbi:MULTISPECIES: thioredoxin family protein [Rhodomicrobium]|uniref:thioredoxin family protein n=1 Tax=Rhodomicrobium TaxID=1068 RepID=UPI000B4B48CD|nr:MULTISPECIES: thioredoxin family protein [Rhodomicrobium]